MSPPANDSGVPGIENRVALVTGASRGIGRAVALALSAAGARLALVGRDAAALSEAARALAPQGRVGEVFTCDVTDESQVGELKDAVERSLGPVEILVNNAGAAVSAPFLATDRDAWERMLETNLTSVFLMTRAFLPRMVERQSGRVIHVASTAGKVGYPYVAAYCAAKHGVVGLTRALALEVADLGITVNAVCPSYVDTPMTDATVANIAEKTGRTAEQARRFLEKQNPQNRLLDAEEVGAAVVYLASAAARGVNGQALNLCGGAVPF